MIEEIAEFLFKAIVAIIRFIGLIVFDGAIFRPIYWLGWLLLKCMTIGAIPKAGINQADYETRMIEYLAWGTGFTLICIFGIFSLS